MVIVIDNYDSFTWNLVQQIERVTGKTLDVVRNDAFDVEQVVGANPEAIVISPGPGTPEHAGGCIDLVRASRAIPLLGVCLGHQVIAVAEGGRVVRGPVPVHGKTHPVVHEGAGLFAGCESPMEAARYHSLVVDRESLPEEIRVDALTEDGVVMAIAHRERPLFGLQFHPESFGTTGGDQLIRNFFGLGGDA